MHNAPTVSYPLGRSAWWSAPLCAVWLLGGAVLGLWCVSVDTCSWRQALDLALWLLSGGAGWRAGRAQTRGELQWTGLHWLLVRDGAPTQEGQVSVSLDLQQRLLLRFSSPSGVPRWLLLERACQPRRWQDLRRAVYSRARTSAARAPVGASPDFSSA